MPPWLVGVFCYAGALRRKASCRGAAMPLSTGGIVRDAGMLRRGVGMGGAAMPPWLVGVFCYAGRAALISAVHVRRAAPRARMMRRCGAARSY